MQAALQQNPSAPERKHLVDLPVDLLEWEDVAVFRAERPVKSTEGTVLRAEIRVIDITIDLVSGDARIVLLQAQLLSFHADADEVIGPEHIESLLFRQCQDLSFSCLVTMVRDIRGDALKRSPTKA